MPFVQNLFDALTEKHVKEAHAPFISTLKLRLRLLTATKNSIENVNRLNFY